MSGLTGKDRDRHRCLEGDRRAIAPTFAEAGAAVAVIVFALATKHAVLGRSVEIRSLTQWHPESETGVF